MASEGPCVPLWEEMEIRDTAAHSSEACPSLDLTCTKMYSEGSAGRFDSLVESRHRSEMAHPQYSSGG